MCLNSAPTGERDGQRDNRTLSTLTAPAPDFTLNFEALGQPQLIGRRG